MKSNMNLHLRSFTRSKRNAERQHASLICIGFGGYQGQQCNYRIRKKYAYISIYGTNVGMLFGFEDHVNRILAPNRVRGIFHHKKTVDILLSKTSWFHTSVQVLILGMVRASCGLVSEACIRGRAGDVLLRTKLITDVQIKRLGLLEKRGWKRVKGNLYLSKNALDILLSKTSWFHVSLHRRALRDGQKADTDQCVLRHC